VRPLQDYIDGIRKAYERDWDSKDLQERQMAVALYFIDKLALRAGHEKDEDEADTVGCCTLKARFLEPCALCRINAWHSVPSSCLCMLLQLRRKLLLLIAPARLASPA
jgi:DNA topoisomerase IB